MCAICGVIDLKSLSADSARDIEQVRDAMRHRGPDDAGLYADEQVVLGVRRLSVIDLQGGHQPISNEDQTVWVALNGEIYNYRSLRKELESAGHRFKTASDTETLAHLYEEKGDAFAESLRGMFAAVVWDKRRRRLVLARDRIGIKPLYYADQGSRLLFASELRALALHPNISFEIDRIALDQYLQFGYIPAPRTILKGIRKLLPGHRLIFDSSGCRIERYWKFPWPDQQRVRVVDQRQTLEQFRSIFSESIRLHLQSDVPVGVLLSGGLDSTLILDEICRQGGATPHTFTIGFGEASFDESSYARTVAQRYGTKHFMEQLSSAQALAVAETVAGDSDEPLADSSSIPTWWLSRFARRHVTVALSGDGGDELFGGYPTYPAHRLSQWYARTPSVIRKGFAEPLIRAWPVSHRNMSPGFLAQRFVRGAGRPIQEQHRLWMGPFSDEERTRLWDAPRQEELAIDLGKASDPAETAMRIDLQTYLPDDLLVKMDRMSMAHSLEARVPFLDHPLVEFAVGLPMEMKIRGWQTKWLLRELLRSRIPEEIRKRPKKGFGTPVSAWLCGPLRELAETTFDSKHVQSAGFFSPQTVSKMWRSHLSRRTDFGRQLWALLMFDLWHRRIREQTTCRV